MELALDPTTTALVMVDLQKGIARDTRPHAAEEVVARAASLAKALRTAGATIVWVRVENHPDGRDRPALGREASDLVITKRGWSAFHGTELDLQLRRRAVRTIVLGGISTNVGVETTARSAYDHGYEQILVEDAMACRSADEHTWTIQRVFPKVGRVRTTVEVLAALRSLSDA
jgi:nicotinamidase-related amidase